MLDGRALLVPLAWLFADAAQAQVSVQETPDRVMVLPIQVSDPALAELAGKLDGLLVQAVGEFTPLVPVSEVPRFEEQGYDAPTYLQSCPPTQYAGCMLVVAQRADIDWSIGGELEPAGLGGNEAQLTVHVVDIDGSREVMAFGVVVGGATDDAVVVDGVAGVFQKVLGGLASEVDVRGDLDDPAAQAAFEERRQKLISASLAQLESELGEVIREDIAMGRLEAPKLTRKDLAEYAGRDDRPPWEQLGMGQAQYLRFENSGASLLDWRRRLRGRLGQVLLRVDFGGGPGPYGLHHEGRWLVAFDEVSGQFFNSAIRQYQEARRTGGSHVQFELGFGVLPWVEVAGVFGLRNAPFTYRFDQDVAEDPVSIVDPVVQTTGRTTEFGVRMQGVPMPTYPIRPTVHAGFFSWKGGSIVPEQEPMIELTGPQATYLQFGGGAEASAGRYLNLFVRGHAEVLTSGTWFDERQDGEVGALEAFDEPTLGPTGSPSPGWGIQAGLQVRIGLLPDPKVGRGARGSAGPDDDGVEPEPDL